MNFLGSFLSTLKPRYDDDVIDRLNYYYTTIIILVLAITISAKYAENYCFVQNTYWLPLNDPIPRDYHERDTRQIGYYQWVPFVLAIEAMLFYVPCIVWRLLNWQSGINVDSVVTMAADSKNIQTDQRERAVATISRHIEDAIELQRDFGAHSKGAVTYLAHCGKSKGHYVTLLYMAVKLMYVANVVGQFFLLNAFLGPKYYFWGAEILTDLANGKEWEESGHFPRVTMCDFEVRTLGNLHRFTIQCVLMINMFNEKIFLFLWWWYLFVACVTILNLFYWIGISLAEKRQLSFIARYLRIADSIHPSDRRAVHKFVHQCLRRDGVFMIRMIGNHAGDLVATEIIHILWKSFKAKLNKIYKPSLLLTPGNGGSGGGEPSGRGYFHHHPHPPPTSAPPAASAATPTTGASTKGGGLRGDDAYRPLISSSSPAQTPRSRTPSYEKATDPASPTDQTHITAPAGYTSAV